MHNPNTEDPTGTLLLDGPQASLWARCINPSYRFSTAPCWRAVALYGVRQCIVLWPGVSAPIFSLSKDRQAQAFGCQTNREGINGLKASPVAGSTAKCRRSYTGDITPEFAVYSPPKVWNGLNYNPTSGQNWWWISINDTGRKRPRNRLHDSHPASSHLTLAPQVDGVIVGDTAHLRAPICGHECIHIRC